jgi:hypothetical protein
MLNSVILVFANKQDMVRQPNLLTIFNVDILENICFNHICMHCIQQ